MQTGYGRTEERIPKKIRLLKKAHKFELTSLKEDINEKMYDILYLNLILSFNKI